MLPLGALMLAASVGSWAQSAPTTAPATATLSTVTVKDSADVQSKDTLRVKKTTVGKGNQVSAHVDRYSPLATNQPEQLARYALHRVAAHNLAGMAAELTRLIPGRRGRRRRCGRPVPPSPS